MALRLVHQAAECVPILVTPSAPVGTGALRLTRAARVCEPVSPAGTTRHELMRRRLAAVGITSGAGGGVFRSAKPRPRLAARRLTSRGGRQRTSGASHARGAAVGSATGRAAAGPGHTQPFSVRPVRRRPIGALIDRHESGAPAAPEAGRYDAHHARIFTQRPLRRGLIRRFQTNWLQLRHYTTGEAISGLPAATKTAAWGRLGTVGNCQ